MKETLTLDFCNLTFYNNYVVAVINEGINIDRAYNKILIDVISQFYNNKPFVYITHRVNSYSVDPHTYSNTVLVKNLVGFSVVSKDYKSKVNAKIEQMFFTKPFEIFTELDEAFKWADQLIAKNIS